VEKINNKFGRLEEGKPLDGFEDWNGWKVHWNVIRKGKRPME
jgi:hypothetical protein